MYLQEETAVVSQYAENLLNLMQIGTKDSERNVVENVSWPSFLI